METRLDVRNIDLRNAQEMIEDNMKLMQKTGRKVALTYAGLFGMAYDGVKSIVAQGRKIVSEAESRGEKMEAATLRQMKETQRGVEKRMKKVEKEVEKAQKRLIKQVHRSETQAENEMDTQMERVLDRLGIPSRDRIAKLSAEIEALSLKIDQHAVAPAPVVEMTVPLAEYNTMTAREIIALMDEMNPAQLAEIAAYEAAHDNRVTIIREVERRMEAMQTAGEAVAA